MVIVCHRLLSILLLFKQLHFQNRSFVYLDELGEDCFEELWDVKRGEDRADFAGSISKLS